MYRHCVVVVLALMCASCSCLPGGYSPWERDVVHDGIRFDKIRYSKSGTIITHLAQKTVIEGFPCQASWVHFYSDWKLQNAFSSERVTVNGIDIPEGTWVEFHRDGYIRMCAFPDNIVIQGLTCKGTGGATGVQTGFYPSGRLKWFFSKGDVTIEGIPCNGGVFSIIGLHEDGSVMACRLAGDVVIDGKRYKKRTQMKFEGDGRVVEAR